MQQAVNKVYAPVFTTKKRYTILMGGRGAGRSTVASQYSLAKLMAKEYFRAAIMRYILGDVRSSIYQEITDRADEADVLSRIKVNDTVMTFEYGQNSINSKGFKKSTGQQKAKLKSLANYSEVVIEEADEVAEEDFTQLDDSLRTTKVDIRIIMMLNPPAKNHWIITRFFDLEPVYDEGKLIEGFYKPVVKPSMIDDVEFIHTSYLDNRINIADHTAKNYENYKWLKPTHYWNMIRGLVPETVVGKIYKGWEVIDKIPMEARYIRNGLDFGYTNDPSAIIAIFKWNDSYILDEISYRKGMKNAEIADIIKANGDMFTVADSSEPKSIDEISDRGANIFPAQKGPGSVLQGIEHVQSLKIFVTKRSSKILKEYENYAWAINKDTGEAINEPKAGSVDHAMDAIRYGLQYDMPDTAQDDIYVAGGGVDAMYDDITIAGGAGAQPFYQDMTGGTYPNGF